RNDAAASLEGVAESGRPLEALGARVDAAYAERDVLGPERHQPPAQQVERALAGLRVITAECEAVGRRRVVARRRVRHRIRGLEQYADLAKRCLLYKPAAHFRKCQS